MKNKLVEGQRIIFTLILDPEPNPEPDSDEILISELDPAHLKQIIFDLNRSRSGFNTDGQFRMMNVHNCIPATFISLHYRIVCCNKLYRQ
jgi:hypothetical protein